MIESSAAAAPATPSRELKHEVILWGGFGLCLVIAVLTVVWPELSGGDAANKRSQPPSQVR